MGSGRGCQDVPGQLPGSTAKHVGSANVSGRGRATLGTGPRCPLSLASGRAASEAQVPSSPLLPGCQSSSQFHQGTSEEPGCQVRHFHLDALIYFIFIFE